MLTGTEFVRQSLDLHLFFVRIMKKHSFFLKIAFAPKNANLAEEADKFRLRFEALLSEVANMSNGVAGTDVLESGEVVTPYTLQAEKELINTANNFANEFAKLEVESKAAIAASAQIKTVTEDSLKDTEELREFKEEGVRGLLDCQVKSIILPLLSDHVLREANHYLRLFKEYNKA